MKYTITGSNLQFANIELEQGEEFFSQAGAMKYMTGNMTMEAKAKGGVMKSIGRMFMGESLFLVKYTVNGGKGIVGIGGNAPGKILDINLNEGTWIAQKTAYLGGEAGVNLEVTFQKKLGAIFFGGEGFILQKISGSGMAFLESCGDLITVDLAPGQMYKVSTSHAVAWQESVKYDIAAAGGIKTALFGGEGLFVTTLTGPGKVIIQSMTIPELAGSLIPFIPTGK
ncbi:MAG: TIGR00266 family protein [Methanomassiliicoccaceae archaeon]|nr:TIGR00266 family protein [Methanomassiliicoccaceae archaeon]